MIGLFRRESSGSGDIGSDPALANHLVAEIRTPIIRSNDRRSASICAVAPIAETSETGTDPLGALIEVMNTANYSAIPPSQRKNFRRASLLELNG